MSLPLDFNHPYKEIFWSYGFSERDIPQDLLDRLYANLKEIHAEDKEAGMSAGVNWLVKNADANTKQIIIQKMMERIASLQNENVKTLF